MSAKTQKTVSKVPLQSIFAGPKSISMQSEDDLRGLAKVMQFMRALSILILLIHIYWFCFDWMESLG